MPKIWHHGGGLSRAGGIAVIRSREQFFIRMRDLYEGNQAKEALITDMLTDWGMHDVRSGNRQEGRTKLVQSLSLRCNPTELRTYSRLLRACVPRLA